MVSLHKHFYEADKMKSCSQILSLVSMVIFELCVFPSSVGCAKFKKTQMFSTDHQVECFLLNTVVHKSVIHLFGTVLDKQVYLKQAQRHAHHPQNFLRSQHSGVSVTPSVFYLFFDYFSSNVILLRLATCEFCSRIFYLRPH